MKVFVFVSLLVCASKFARKDLCSLCTFVDLFAIYDAICSMCVRVRQTGCTDQTEPNQTAADRPSDFALDRVCL